MKSIQYSLVAIILFCITGFQQTVYAQQTAVIEGTVTDSETDEPLPGVNVVIINTNKGTATDASGRFTLRSVPAGPKKVRFSFVGYKNQVHPVTAKAGQRIQINITLEPDPVGLSGIQVTALRPDLQADAQLEKEAVREANPRDSGELLRNVEGVDAVRRGPVGLDPVIRGLRETEVGTYLDGTRIFPGGPARMDSPLSHLDPSAIQTIEVVKGPYALTWGAGNMSAVRVETRPLKTINTPLGGELSSGYDSNYNAFEESASLHGNNGKLGYWLHGAWREGNDYESGNGTTVPGDFLSREIRGKLGYAITSNSYLNVSLGYQNQKNLDYPGRLLDADFFDTYNASANWKWNPKGGLIQSIKASAYINNVDHGMDNDEKPTAQPNPNRTPPFALDVKVRAKAHVTGGRLSAELASNDAWDWEIGTDVYSANRNAVRTIRRRDNSQLLFTDLMWPDAVITDAGFYTRASHSFSDRLSTVGTIRLDLVRTDADTSSDFFAENVSTDLGASETNISGALTLNYILFDNWTIGAGAGSVVRTADATERYSDRVPASKAQTSAEFVGNPSLDPERSTQLDLWIDASYPLWSFSVSVFTRYMDNYITLEPTDLPKRLPLSPETVFQYVNDSARFRGFEARTTYRFIPELRAKAAVHYLWGEDEKVNEPALGVAPLGVDTGLRYESNRWPLFAEGTVHFADRQTRVAATRGETPTDGYVTADIQAGTTFWQRVSLQVGVKNITDVEYVNHLNAKNPFTSIQIPEPGRVFFADVSLRF